MYYVHHIVLNQKVVRIFSGTSHYTENDHINSKSGVNFQVRLKQNCTSGNHVKPDLLVFFNGFSQPFWPYAATVSEIDRIFYALLCVIIQLYKVVCYRTTPLILI